MTTDIGGLTAPQDPLADVPVYARHLLRTEPLAEEIRGWYELRIPGWLQCPELVRAAYHKTTRYRSPWTPPSSCGTCGATRCSRPR